MSRAANLTFHTPVLLGASNYTHFWMPIPLFRAAADPAADLLVTIALHGDSGPWGHCPNPKHPQNCSVGYRLSDGAWEPYREFPGNAPLRLDRRRSRSYGGKVVLDNASGSASTSGTVGWEDIEWTQLSGVRVLDRGHARVRGLPPTYGASLMLLPSAVHLRDDAGGGNRTWVALAYGATVADHAAGAGDRTCVGVYRWQAHFCSRTYVLATTDAGVSWDYRGSIGWRAQMGKHVSGPNEAALTLLADGRTLLAVVRVESHTNLWQALSVDGGITWSPPLESNAWSVFPSMRTLANGVTALVSGRPGLGLWLLEDASAAKWQFHNLAAEHNAACARVGPMGCGANTSYDAFTAGIVRANLSMVKGRPVPISPFRDLNHSTPPMTKGYLGLEAIGSCVPRADAPHLQQAQASSSRRMTCDLIITYDRDCNGGEGPDCPTCPVRRPHGNEDRVYAMRVSVKSKE